MFGFLEVLRLEVVVLHITICHYKKRKHNNSTREEELKKTKEELEKENEKFQLAVSAVTDQWIHSEGLFKYRISHDSSSDFRLYLINVTHITSFRFSSYSGLSLKRGMEASAMPQSAVTFGQQKNGSQTSSVRPCHR